MRIPKLRKHSSGQGRVTLRGRTYYCGKYGTEECQAEYNRLVGEWVANGGTILKPEAKADLRVTEMFLRYVTWAKEHYGSSNGEFDRIKRIVKLTKLESQDSQKAQLVKLRFFAGLTNKQAATALGISTATADRAWAFARA